MIEIENLTEEEIVLLKEHFLKKRIIKLKDILTPIDQYFVKFDFNSETQKYELYLGIPKDWLHDMTMSGYVIELYKENEVGKIIKLITTSEDFVGDLDEMVVFAEDIIERNNAIMAKIREKEAELQQMKNKMIEVQMALDREIEKLKVIKNGDEPIEESVEENVSEEEVEIEKPVVITPVVKKESSVGAVYNKPITMSPEEADKFAELVRNGKS